VDQSFAPLDEDDQARRERLRSAKKKKELLNLRSKMRGQGLGTTQQPQANQDEDGTRGRGYAADAYADDTGYGAGGYGQPQQQQQPRASANPRVPSAQAVGASRRGPSASPPPSEYPEDGGLSGGGNDIFSGGGGTVPEGADEVVETFPCPICERRFNAQALQKHIAKQICKQKPRKVFDMAAQRLEDLAKEAREAGIKLVPAKPVPAGAAPAAAAGGGGGGGGKDGKPVKKMAKWRQDHEKFMAAIQAGKQLQAAIASGVPLSSLPPPPAQREEDDDRTPCPHCGRKFSATVAERHIPHCKNTKAKPKATVASAARLGSTMAGSASAAASSTARRR